MLEIAAQEFVPWDPAGPGPAGLPIAVLEADGFTIQAEDAPVGQGDAEDGAGQIVEHGLFPHTPVGNVHDPRGCARRRRADSPQGSASRTRPGTDRAPCGPAPWLAP